MYIIHWKSKFSGDLSKILASPIQPGRAAVFPWLFRLDSSRRNNSAQVPKPNPGSSARVHINVSETQWDTPPAPLSLHCPRSSSAPRGCVFQVFSASLPLPPLAFPNTAQAEESSTELHFQALLRAELPYVISQVGFHLLGITSSSHVCQISHPCSRSPRLSLSSLALPHLPALLKPSITAASHTHRT